MIPSKLYKKKFLYSINMPNINQNNETDYINKEISLLEDRLKINEKSQNQFQNVLTRIKRLRLKQGQRTNLSKGKKIQSMLKDIFKNKIKNIKKKRMIY